MTDRRRELLDAIANGQVMTDVLAEADRIVLFPDAPTSWQDRVTVTARVRQLAPAPHWLS